MHRCIYVSWDGGDGVGGHMDDDDYGKMKIMKISVRVIM